MIDWGNLRGRASVLTAPKRFAAATCLLILAATSHASFFDRFTNPTITVDIQHPPSLGLQVERLAFGPASGECSDQITDALIDDFVSNGIEVIDRANLDLILAEHDFVFSGYVNQASAARLGEILGPSALLIVNVQRCVTEKKRLRSTVTRYKDDRKYEQPVYTSRTRAFLKLSIRTVDLTTGRIFTARTLDYSPEREFESYDGYPEYPSEYDILDIAFNSTVRDVHRMFLPWTEETGLIFYDDKACGLKGAYQTLRAGLLEQTLAESMRNLEACKTASKTKPKTLAHAFYNVGMAHFLLNNHDAALELLLEAAKLRPGDVVTEALTNVRKSKALLASMQEIEQEAALEVARREAAAVRAVDDALTNDDVIAMSDQGIPEAIILRKIQTSRCRFDTSARALGTLTKSGVGENVIMAMMDVD